MRQFDHGLAFTQAINRNKLTLTSLISFFLGCKAGKAGMADIAEMVDKTGSIFIDPDPSVRALIDTTLLDWSSGTNRDGRRVILYLTCNRSALIELRQRKPGFVSDYHIKACIHFYTSFLN